VGAVSQSKRDDDHDDGDRDKTDGIKGNHPPLLGHFR
jgi:hypothetical protein